MAEIARKPKRYPSDLINEDWARLARLTLKPPRCGRKLIVDLRKLLDAIRCAVSSVGGLRSSLMDFKSEI